MDAQSESGDAPVVEQHIVKADEVDQTGTDISPVSDDQLMEEVAEELRQEQSSSPIPVAEPESTEPQQSAKRPDLRRDTAAPPPPLQPPPPAPVQQQNMDRSADSLSLAQLRRLVQEMPKVEQPAYAFEYADAQSFPDEIDEWFQYNEFDRVMLMGMKRTFDRQWGLFCQPQNLKQSEQSWVDSPDHLRREFMTQSLDKLQDPEILVRLEALENICYTVSGVWGLTAGRSTPDYPDNPDFKTSADMPRSKSLQIEWIERNITLVQECSGIPILVKKLSQLFGRSRSPGSDGEGASHDRLHTGEIPAPEREANLVLTLLYFAIEVGRKQEARDPQCTPVRDALTAADPCLLVTIVEIIARLRWDETANIPLTRIILLLWKSLLLVFGGSDQLKRAKEVLEPAPAYEEDYTNRRGPFLHASPLDYHLFRQEITSKYPAYNPPPPIVPLELENNTILPPIPQHPNRSNSSSGLFGGVGPSIAGGNGSILQQAVHIATPAPSPPPSPIGPGGKAGKKQNYQTNQNFPLMYPPLDDSSNSIGGKGTTERQDAMASRRWEGSDVPASIIEAGRLFSTHVKMTRSMQQLWDERENFLKYDRGWNFEKSQPLPNYGPVDDLSLGLDDLDLSAESEPEPKQPPKQTDDVDVQRRLDAVEAFYSKTLLHLQSITIVFLKIILTNVSAVVSQGSSQTQTMGTGTSSTTDVYSEMSIEELDNIRLREITSKAVSGTLLLMVKWFKRSHVLKFEYMTQLLLDSNYLPLILKMFAHQDVDQAVAQRNDRDDLAFFYFCRENCDSLTDLEDTSGDTESEDDACPPPISRTRPTFQSTPSARFLPTEECIPDIMDGPTRPEVDELGYPTAPPPKEPITVFSFRNFFSAINYLHIMQKITRDKAHRALLLVQYKSSAILRKGLKIPDPHLRFYTLKLFKSQVPFCSRKWRQGNMRVITAIYLYCRPELRDDWLAGADIDAEIDEALPLEQALRGLTHWWHLRQYKETMGGPEGTSMMEEERDFFVRELESMGWGFAEDLVEDTDMGSQMVSGTEWDGGLQMEGWA